MAYNSKTEVFYGSLDCFSIAMNLLSLIALRKVSKLFNHEVLILIGSITILSLSGCTLFVIKIVKNFQGPGNMASLVCLAVPITYNLLLPAILSKGLKQLRPNEDLHFSCSYLYGIVCTSLVVFFVMVISPMPGMDYHKFQQPVHAPHPGLHTSVATPLLMISGSVPQMFSSLLSLLQIYKISGSLFCCRQHTTVKHATYEHELIKKYLRRWGLGSVICVFPSASMNALGFFLWKVGRKLPASLGFCHALCDTLLFLTQPMALILLWLTYKINQLNSEVDQKQKVVHVNKHMVEQNRNSQPTYYVTEMPQQQFLVASNHEPQLVQHNGQLFSIQLNNGNARIHNGRAITHKSLDQFALNSTGMNDVQPSPKKQRESVKRMSFSANSSPVMASRGAFIQSEV